MATLDELSNALINADKAGDADAARTLAAEITRMRAAEKTPEAPTEPEKSTMDKVTGAVDAFGRGIADMATLGFSDELGAAADYAGSHVLPWREAKTFDQALADTRGDNAKVAEEHPVADIAGKVTGVVGGAAGLARAGLSPTVNAVTRGSSLGRVAVASGGEGAALGGVAGIGSGEGVEGRIKSGVTGLALGGALGLAAPYAAAGVSQVAAPLVAPIAARLSPGRYAQQAIGDAVRRSGMSVNDITGALSRARADGQDMFAVADAMGNSGQRMLSTVVRNPNDVRQAVVEALQARQSGQGDRLSNFLAEGFGAPDTAAQRATRLTAERTSTANANYGAARDQAGIVDPTRAIQAADDFLSPGASGVMNPGNAIADDSVEAAVRRARGYLTDGNSVLTDFNASLRAKQELDAMIEGARPAVQRQLIPIRNALDDALSATSEPYAQARNTFRQQSRAIDAIDEGRNAASGRVRADDSIPAFQSMSPEEQSAFRAGYVDPLIARVENTAMAPGTNKARPLMTPKTGAEFPAFAEPGRADQLGTRIAREQRMFETSNQAMGGSRTADNLADAAEMAKFDPGVMAKLLRGDVIGALADGGRRILAEGGGLPPRVIEQVGNALMETNPAVARELLNGGMARLARNDGLRARVIQALTNLGAAGAGRLAAP